MYLSRAIQATYNNLQQVYKPLALLQSAFLPACNLMWCTSVVSKGAAQQQQKMFKHTQASCFTLFAFFFLSLRVCFRFTSSTDLSWQAGQAKFVSITRGQRTTRKRLSLSLCSASGSTIQNKDNNANVGCFSEMLFNVVRYWVLCYSYGKKWLESFHQYRNTPQPTLLELLAWANNL